MCVCSQCQICSLLAMLQAAQIGARGASAAGGRLQLCCQAPGPGGCRRARRGARPSAPTSGLSGCTYGGQRAGIRHHARGQRRRHAGSAKVGKSLGGEEQASKPPTMKAERRVATRSQSWSAIVLQALRVPDCLPSPIFPKELSTRKIETIATTGFWPSALILSACSGTGGGLPTPNATPPSAPQPVPSLAR